MSSLTERQREVLSIIKRQITDGEGFPSVREIAERLGVNNPSGISGHIKALIRKGYVRKQSTFALTSENDQSDGQIPLVATIPAGLPTEAFETSDEFLRFDDSYFSNGDIRAVRISGNSMSGDGIRDGDVGIIRMQNRINKNEIAVVRYEGEVTLKRLRKTRTHCELVPSNPDFPVNAVEPDRVEVVGKLVGLVRKT